MLSFDVTDVTDVASNKRIRWPVKNSPRSRKRGRTFVIAASVILTVPQSKGQTARAGAGVAWEYKVVHVKTLVKDASELDALGSRLVECDDSS